MSSPWSVHPRRSLLHRYPDAKTEGPTGERCPATLFPFWENQGAQKSDVDQICPDAKSAGGQTRATT